MTPPPRTTHDAYAWAKAVQQALQHGGSCLSCCVEAARAVVDARDRQWLAMTTPPGGRGER